MIGCAPELGGTTHHSLAYVIIPRGKSSSAHYHKVSEETYIVKRSSALMVVDGKKFNLNAGDGPYLI